MRTINRDELVSYIKHLESTSNQEDNAEYMNGVLELAALIMPVAGTQALSVGEYRDLATGTHVEPEPITVAWDDETDDLVITQTATAPLGDATLLLATVEGAMVNDPGLSWTGDGDLTLTLATASVQLGEGTLTQLLLVDDELNVIAQWEGSIELATPV